MQLSGGGKVRAHAGSGFLSYGLLRSVAARMRRGMHEHDNESDEAERRDGQHAVEHQAVAGVLGYSTHFMEHATRVRWRKEETPAAIK
jgi:hypothetical protein